ncbi:MAG: hypothetical protein EOP22_14330 [Hyphomicrobiales bacterium]|nr:MAG: hypothetical protein EOP22_14330 [Hyphomicrobiales bacterium]
MAQYYFHIRSGDQVYNDSDGVDLGGLPAAWMYALDLARSLLDRRTMGGLVREQSIEIGDGTHSVIASLPFERARTSH